MAKRSAYGLSQVKKSKVKPTQKDLSTYTEYDGYTWKYMYTISDSEWNRFATESIIPV